MSAVVERRRHLRHSVCKILSCQTESTRFLATSVDISSGGVKIDTPVRLEVGKHVDIQLVLEGELLAPKGRIVYCLFPEGRMVSGIEFTELSEKDRRLLDKFTLDTQDGG